MMRMLDEGGLPALTDGIRPADPSNPQGYYELEPVKTTKADSSWLGGAVGKAVKIIHALLMDLPLSYAYRVVFMRRNIEEVVESQNRMLERLRKSDNLPKDRLISIFEAQTDDTLRYLRRHRDHFCLLEIDYNALLRQAAPEVEKVSRFLDGLDVARMAAVIDRDLYRTRIAR